MSVILTQPDVRFGGRRRDESARPMLLENEPSVEGRPRASARTIAVGQEGARHHGGARAAREPLRDCAARATGAVLNILSTFWRRSGDTSPDISRPSGGVVRAGEDAVFALLYAARHEATSKVAERAARDRVASPYDGTLRFGVSPKLGAALNDARTRDELFEACGRNWREFADRPEDMVRRRRAGRGAFETTGRRKRGERRRRSVVRFQHAVRALAPATNRWQRSGRCGSRAREATATSRSRTTRRLARYGRPGLNCLA